MCLNFVNLVAVFKIDKIWKCVSCGCNPYVWSFHITQYLPSLVPIIPAHLSFHVTQYLPSLVPIIPAHLSFHVTQYLPSLVPIIPAHLKAPRIGIPPTRYTLPDFIDCIYSHQINNILFTAFITTWYILRF
jgi:hypothetical protein